MLLLLLLLLLPIVNADADADLESVIESVRGKQIIIMRNVHCWLPLVHDRNSFPTELG